MLYLFLSLLVATILSVTEGFSPACYQQARVIPGATSYKRRVFGLSDKPDPPTDSTAKSPVISADGTYYDDEVSVCIITRVVVTFYGFALKYSFAGESHHYYMHTRMLHSLPMK